MKIKYDTQLYKKIAQLKLNKVLITRNKKGEESVVRIKNITQLSWHELQLIVGGGQDKFSKIVLLYNKYISDGDVTLQSQAQYKGKELNIDETKEIDEYIKIYRDNKFKKHHEVNQFITNNNMWDSFPIMRSLNDHGDNKQIKGILQKYFDIICAILGIKGERGHPLDKATHY